MNLEEINKIRAELGYKPLKPSFGSDGWQAWHDAELERIQAEQRAKDTVAQQLGANQDDMPFLVAWMIWFLYCLLPTTGLALLLQHMTPIAPMLALGWVVGTSTLVSWILTLASHVWHEARQLTPNNDGGWRKRIRVISYEEASKRRRAADEEDSWATYEQRAASRWAEADAKNGLHRSPGLDSGEEPPTDEFALDHGLLGKPHHIKRGWKLTIGFRREED